MNGKPVQSGAKVELGDKVTTGPRSQAVVVLKGDAFLMRADTVIEVKGRDGLLSEMLIASGKVLSVFSKKPVNIKAATASIGIRGTGAYIEVDPGSVYFCLCYGEADIDGPEDADQDGEDHAPRAAAAAHRRAAASSRPTRAPSATTPTTS